MKKYILGLLIVLVIGLLLTSGCKKKEVVQEVVAEEPQIVEPVLEEVEVAPEEVDKCGQEAVISFTGCNKLANGNVEIEVMNTGKAPISGLWYYIQSIDGEYGYEKLDKTFEVKEMQAYEVDIVKWSAKIGTIKQVIVKPILDGKACNNMKRVATITQCK